MYTLALTDTQTLQQTWVHPGDVGWLTVQDVQSKVCLLWPLLQQQALLLIWNMQAGQLSHHFHFASSVFVDSLLSWPAVNLTEEAFQAPSNHPLAVLLELTVLANIYINSPLVNFPDKY